MSNELEIEAARYRLGVATGQDLVRAAEAAMLAGIESETLVHLAIETDPIMSDVGPLFERTLLELSIEIPGEGEACWALLRHHMLRIATREVNPRAGAQAILDEVYYPGDLYEQAREYIGDSHDLHHILGNLYGIDDLLERPEEVSFDGKYGAEAIAAMEAHLHELAVKWLREHGA